MSDHRYFAIVPAAGVGARMQADRPKQYLECAGKTILEHALSRLLSWPRLSKLVVALDPADQYFSSLSCSEHAQLMTCEGGAERSDSVLSALESLSSVAEADDWILVHDAARPCIRHTQLEKLASELGSCSVGGLLALPVSDTVKRAGDRDKVVETLDRSMLWLAQTPQMFRYRLLLDAMRAVRDAGETITDEASAIERAGMSPRLVVGSHSNIKVTHRQDLALAEHWLTSEEVQ